MSKRALVVCALAIGLGGCATWRKQGVMVSPPRKLRLALLPLDLDFKAKKAADLETVVSTEPATAAASQREAESIKERLKEELAADLEVRISSSYFFSPISHRDAEKAMAALNLSTAAALSAEQSRELARVLNADVLLKVQVHGYGRIKRSWLLALWGSSFIEGGVQGAAVAAASASVWAAVGVAAEEVLQEGFEWFGGGYLVDRYYAPVVIEGDAFSGRTGKNIWGRWFAVTKNKTAVKRLPPAEQKRKEVRLFLTFQKARDRMMKKLEEAALKNQDNSETGRIEK